MRLCMPCTDRPGLLLDISQALVNWECNIVSVEMDKGALYLECHIAFEEQKPQIMKKLQQVNGIHEVIEVTDIPSKERANQLETVLTFIQDGVLAVNALSILKQCNKVAANILKLKETSLEQPLSAYLLDRLLIARTLREGGSFRNREVFLESIGSYCVVSTRPLRNERHEVVGAVVMIRDSRDVRGLVQKMMAATPVTFKDIAFISPVMEKIIEQARRYAVGSAVVLICGETGTGKELFARALHSASPRAGMTFLSVNCATIPEPLLESELFGYEERSFSNILRGGKPGLFELANGGTLFLDEIGEMSIQLQTKLLRVLQERRVRRLGSSHELTVDVRVVAATYRDLEELVKRQLFRKELYYRLNVVPPLCLPPLRNRVEDIPFLAEHFLKRLIANLNHSARGFSSEAIEKLQTYSWPGNVRELENVIEQAIHLMDGMEIQPEHIQIDKKTSLVKLDQNQFEPYQTLAEQLGEIERNILRETMKKFRSSREAGAVLGLSHTAVLRKLKKHGLRFGGY